MTDQQTIELAKSALAIWQNYPIPAVTEHSTESERIWRAFLMDKRIAYNALSAQ